MVGIAIFGDFGDEFMDGNMALASPNFSRRLQEKAYGPSLGDELRVRGELGLAPVISCDPGGSDLDEGLTFFFIKMDGLTSWAIHLEVSHLVSQSEKMDDPKKIAYKDSFDGKHDDPTGFGVYPNLLDKPISSQPSMEHRAAWKWFHIEWLL